MGVVREGGTGDWRREWDRIMENRAEAGAELYRLDSGEEV